MHCVIGQPAAYGGGTPPARGCGNHIDISNLAATLDPFTRARSGAVVAHEEEAWHARRRRPPCGGAPRRRRGRRSAWRRGGAVDGHGAGHEVVMAAAEVVQALILGWRHRDDRLAGGRCRPSSATARTAVATTSLVPASARMPRRHGHPARVTSGR